MVSKKRRNTNSSKKADRTQTPSARQASSLSEALYQWLSKRHPAIQNAILVVFAAGTVLFFSANIIDFVGKAKEFLPRPIPKIYGVICNETGKDVKIRKTGHYIVHSSPPFRGEFNLYTEPATDRNQITVPSRGGEVKVYAKISSTPEVRDRYKVGEYSMTLRLETPDQSRAVVATVEKFSKTGRKQEWVASITDKAIPWRTIRVCFERMSDDRKRAIVQGDTGLSGLQQKALLESETDRLKGDLEERAEAGKFFVINSPEFYRDVLKNRKILPPSTVLAKIAVGVYELEDSDKIVLVDVNDIDGKIEEGNGSYSRRYSLHKTSEERIIQIISDATAAIIKEYPIEGRITEVFEDGEFVEIGVGRLAGIRYRMRLYVYNVDKLVGEVIVTASWPGTCEGIWKPYSEGKEAHTSFIVSSKMKES